jgi:hypothetical protein
MLANKHIYEEIKYIEDVREKIKDDYEKANLKAQVLIVKLLHNIRTNMVNVMKHQGIPLVESNIEKTEEIK